MSNSMIHEMLMKYNCMTDQDYVNALREIMQVITLQALARSDFFNHAAFYGGTSLRILYGLDRGSEDMDFSLLHPEAGFDLMAYADCLEKEFASFGMTALFAEKIKMTSANIQSGFLKSNTQTQLLAIGLNQKLTARINSRSEIKIKIEVDLQPPAGFNTEIKYLGHPSSFAVRSYALPDLLAGKLHAVLFRRWKNRVKGRDWYDLAWYAERYPHYNLKHLENRIRQSEDYLAGIPLSDTAVKKLLTERLEKINMDEIKNDIRPFLRNTQMLHSWDKKFFSEVFQKLMAV